MAVLVRVTHTSNSVKVQDLRDNDGISMCCGAGHGFERMWLVSPELETVARSRHSSERKSTRAPSVDPGN